jgi:hypothetical protein
LGNLRRALDGPGYLQQFGDATLQKDNHGRYSFVQPEAVTLRSSFDSGPGYNVMRLSGGVATPGADYKSQLAADEGDDGFQLLALDRGSLAPLPNYPRKYGTNTSSPAHNGAALSELAADLKAALDADAFVVLQSIGKPRPTAPAWGDVAAQLKRIGASGNSFNTLDGTADPPDPLEGRHGGEYAVAGCAGCQQPAESSYPPNHIPGTGSVTALLRPAADYRYDVSFGDPGDLGEGTTGYLPTQIAYQDPEPWPTWSGAGEQQALRYITDQLAAKLGLDKADRADWCHRSPSRPLDLRDAYCGGTTWPDDVESLVPFPRNKGFTRTDWNSVRQQLNLEFHYVNQVRASFDTITKVLSLEQGTNTSPREVGQYIVESIGGQTSSEVDGAVSEGLTAAMEVVSEAALLFPEAEPVAVITGIGAALLGAAGDTTHGTDGASELIERIRARADEFPDELTNDYLATLVQLGHLHKLIVSDWGRLRAFATMVKPDPDQAGNAAAARRVALTRWLWQEILPAAYGVVTVRPARSLDDLKSLKCFAIVNNLPYYPFSQVSDADVWSPVDGFDPQMHPTSSLQVMADGDYTHAAVAFPPDDLLTGVFERPGHTVDPLHFHPETGPIIAKPTFFERADWRSRQTWDPARCPPR